MENTRKRIGILKKSIKYISATLTCSLMTGLIILLIFLILNGVFYFPLIFAIGAVCVALHKFSLRLTQPSAEELIIEDSRQPVLLLRAFKRDNECIRKSEDLISSFHFNLTTYEERLVEILNKTGPVVAMGHPKEIIQPLGASRIYEKDEKWKEKVMKFVETSCLVVIIVDNTPGVCWELEEIFKSNHLSKLLLIFPPLKEFSTTKERELWYEGWENLRVKFDFIPKITDNAIAIQFSDFRRPLVIYSTFDDTLKQLAIIESHLGRRQISKKVNQAKTTATEAIKIRGDRQKLKDCRINTTDG